MNKAARSNGGLGLSAQVLAAIVLGIIVGALWPHFGAALKPLADGFVKLIRMLLAPIVFATVVLGIARMGDLKAVGRVGIKAIVYFEILSTLALVLGLVYVNVFAPGSSFHVDPKTLDTTSLATYTTAAKAQTPTDFILGIIPSSPIDAFARGDMLQVILFAILFGIALTRFRDRAQPLLDVIDLILQGFFGIVAMVMRLAPLGAFGGMAFTVGKYGVHSLLALGQLVVGTYAVSVVFGVVVLGIVARIAQLNLWKLLRYFKEELLITFGTSSSEAVLPRVMAKLENLGCEKTVVGLVVPAGYTFNADGTAIYLSLAAIFVAQATGTHLSLAQQLGVLAILMLTSKGSAGVAGAGFVTLAATLSSIGTIPVAGLVLLLGVDRFVNAARATLNVIGNTVATVVVARWEGVDDASRAARVLDGETIEEADEPERVLERRELGVGG